MLKSIVYFDFSSKKSSKLSKYVGYIFTTGVQYNYIVSTITNRNFISTLVKLKLIANFYSKIKSRSAFSITKYYKKYIHSRIYIYIRLPFW